MRLLFEYYDDDEFNANIRYSIASSNTNLDISPRDIDVNATPYHSMNLFHFWADGLRIIDETRY